MRLEMQFLKKKISNYVILGIKKQIFLANKDRVRVGVRRGILIREKCEWGKKHLRNFNRKPMSEKNSNIYH